MRKTCIAMTLGVAAVLSQGSYAFGQSTNSGDIRGIATDATGSAIPDATVTVENLEKGITSSYTTNGAGLFDTGPIITGPYKITFTKDGFAPFVRSGVNLQVGTITINAALGVGGVSQEVVVTTDVPLIKTETGEQSTTLDAVEMQHRPNVGQDWQNFIKFLPGTTGTSQFGATGQGLSSNGNLPYNSVMADGASSSLSHSGNADVSVFESVQEVQVSTSAFSAQYGQGGVIMNQISKGGTNQFHGSVYEYAQNDFLNARSFFQTSKGYSRFHNFGGSVGGPILKNRAFFYFNADKIINLSASTGYITVPTLAMRAGDFSSLAPIYNPATTTVVGGKLQRSQFAGNKLTAIDPVAAKIQAFLPLPNTPGAVNASTGITSNNYYYNGRGTSPFMKYFGRFDYQFSPSNRLTASVTKRDNPAFSVNQNLCPINCYTGDVDSYNAQITDVWNISSRTINEVRLGYTNQLNFFATQTAGKGYPSQLGLQFSKADIFPTINITNYYALTAGTTAIYKEHTFDPSDVVTMIRGHHVMHFGGEYLIYQDNSTAWGNVNGATTGFTGTYTQCTACGTTTPVIGGNGYADFLLGNIQNWSAQVTPEFAGRQKAPQVFFQDDWKLTPKLTVNLGLRYQVQLGWSDAKGNQRTFDPTITNAVTQTPGAMWYGTTKANGRSAAMNSVYSTFLPRFGVAYQVRPDTVIRAGYGLYAYNWSLDTYGSAQGAAFGQQGSLSDNSGGIAPIGSLSGTNPQFTYVSASTVNSAFNGQNVNYQAVNTPVARIHQYNVTIEKQFDANDAVSIAYVGSRAFDLIFNRDINQVPLGKLAPNAQASRPYPQFGTITGSTYNSDSNYNSLQVQYTRRMSRNVSTQASYTWSKFLNEFDSSAWGSRGGTTTYQNSYDVGANYGPSNFDVRNGFRGTTTAVLPFGKGQRFLNSNWLVDEFIGGWGLSANYILQGGNPITITCAQNNTYALSGNCYPNQISDPRMGAKRNITQWYNQAAFAQPAPGTFGNMRRNSVYGPGLIVLDMSASKTFNLYKERVKFQLRIDATNALNHPNFSNPATSLASAPTITSVQGGGRVMQLGGRVSF
jgi:hypothetical protein